MNSSSHRLSQDPVSAQQAARVNSATVILDDYNPFDEDEKSNSKSSQYNEGSTNPMVSKSTPPPPYNQNASHSTTAATNQAYGSASGAPQISTAELQVTYIYFLGDGGPEDE